MASTTAPSSDGFEVELWAIKPMHIKRLDKALPVDIFPISFKIELHLAPIREPHQYTERQEDGTLVDKKFCPPERSFALERLKQPFQIPNTKVELINPLERGNVTMDHKQTPRDDEYGNSHENDRQRSISEVARDIRSAVSRITNSSDQEAAERLYVSDFRVAKVHDDMIITDPERIPDDCPYDGRAIAMGEYENEHDCWIYTFSSAASRDMKINATGAKDPDRKDGAVDNIAPGNVAVPRVLTKIERVTTKPLKGRKSDLKQAYYRKKQAEQHGKRALAPKDWDLENDLSNADLMTTLLEEHAPSIVEAAGSSGDECVFTKVQLSGDSRDRHYFDVSGVE